MIRDQLTDYQLMCKSLQFEMDDVDAAISKIHKDKAEDNEAQRQKE